jgi:hypothetical protein
MTTLFITTSRDMARIAAKRWREHYLERHGHWTATVSGPADVTYAKLVELGENPDHADVEAIIGNKSWTRGDCDGCDRQDLDAWVTVGAERGYDTNTAILCPACVAAATKLFDSAPSRIYADWLEDRGFTEAAAALRNI